MVIKKKLKKYFILFVCEICILYILFDRLSIIIKKYIKKSFILFVFEICIYGL